LLLHTSGQFLQMEYTLPTVKQDPQAAGSAITYARRYALQSIAGIPTADDDAESAMLRGDHKNPLSADQSAQIKALLEETSTDVAKFCKWLKVSSVDKVLAIHYDRAVAALEAKK